MSEQEYKLHQGVKMWNILASVFFVVLCVLMYVVFAKLRPNNFGVSFFDILILILGTFRLVRLFIYDNITLFLREFFMDLHIEGEENKKYTYKESKSAFKLTMYKLLNCPWCFGVWVSFVAAFLYFSFPVFKLVFVVLAISSVASLLILIANLIGWLAEEKKLKVQKM